jgi:hypothetical protein
VGVEFDGRVTALELGHGLGGDIEDLGLEETRERHVETLQERCELSDPPEGLVRIVLDSGSVITL